MPLGEKFFVFDSPQIALRDKDEKEALYFLNYINQQLRDHNFRGIFLTNNISPEFKNMMANFADAFIPL